MNTCKHLNHANEKIFSRVKKKLILIFCNIMLLYDPVFSQHDSLDAYINIALKNNPEILQKYYEYEAALQKVTQVGSLPDPELSMGIFLSPMEIVSGSQVADIRLMQMFPWWGTLRAAKDEMSLMAKARYEELKDAKLKVFFEVKKTYYELYKIRKNIQIYQVYLNILNILEQLSLSNYTVSTKQIASSSSQSISSNAKADGNQSGVTNGMVGMQMAGSASMNLASTNQSGGMSMNGESMTSASMQTGMINIFRIQIEKNELNDNLKWLNDQYLTLSVRFNTLLNRSSNEFISIPDTIVVDSIMITLSAVSDSMLMNNPMLQMWKYEQQSIDSRKNMVTRMGYPMIGVGVNYSVINKSSMSSSTMNGTDMIMPMVTISLPIYRKKYRAMRTETELLAQAAKEAYASTANLLQTEYYQAIEQYNQAQRNISLYANQTDYIKRILNLMVVNYTANSQNFEELLRTWKQALDYQLKQNDALADYQIAIARLQRLMANFSD